MAAYFEGQQVYQAFIPDNGPHTDAYQKHNRKVCYREKQYAGFFTDNSFFIDRTNKEYCYENSSLKGKYNAYALYKVLL
jgi:hypothetical protein